MDSIKWKIYYGDKKTFSNLDGDIYSIPPLNVQAICVLNKDVGRIVLSHRDFYGIDGENWLAFDLFGLFDYLTQNGPKKVLFGRTIKNEQFEEIMKIALTDPDFPIKSAKHPVENRW